MSRVIELEESISAAIGGDLLSFPERVAVRKKLGELVRRAALFDELVATIETLLDIVTLLAKAKEQK